MFLSGNGRMQLERKTASENVTANNSHCINVQIKAIYFFNFLFFEKCFLIPPLKLLPSIRPPIILLILLHPYLLEPLLLTFIPLYNILVHLTILFLLPLVTPLFPLPH